MPQRWAKRGGEALRAVLANARGPPNSFERVEYYVRKDETPGSDTTDSYVVTNGELGIALIELVVTVCALALPSQCEDQHLPFSADMSLNQCVMNAQPYIAQWINEHPKWVAVRWRCDYGGSKEKA
jgi:hypothetical protein